MSKEAITPDGELQESRREPTPFMQETPDSVVVDST
jgi:hypothetical protein